MIAKSLQLQYLMAQLQKTVKASTHIRENLFKRKREVN